MGSGLSPSISCRTQGILACAGGDGRLWALIPHPRALGPLLCLELRDLARDSSLDWEGNPKRAGIPGTACRNTECPLSHTCCGAGREQSPPGRLPELIPCRNSSILL